MILRKSGSLLLSLWVSIAVGYSTLEAEPINGKQSAKFDFSNITNSSGFISLRNFGGHGVQVADATGDGLVDVYVTNIGDDPKVSRLFECLGLEQFILAPDSDEPAADGDRASEMIRTAIDHGARPDPTKLTAELDRHRLALQELSDRLA